MPISVRAVTYAHLCPFCGWHRLAESTTMLSPSCEECGGTLHAVEAAAVEDAKRFLRLQRSARERGAGLWGAC